MVIILVVAGLTAAFAQPINQGKMKMKDGSVMAVQGKKMNPDRMPNIPDLTDAQKAKIDELKLKYSKLDKPVRDQIEEKQLKLHNLLTSDEINKNDAYKVAGELSDLQLKMKKSQIDKKVELNQILTEKQRLFLNERGNKRGGFGMGF